MNNFTKKALILAGGRGTRLQSVTGGSQKVIVKVGNKTFLQIILEKLCSEKFNEIYLATGYQALEVKKIIKQIKLPIKINIIQEDKPLGTGHFFKSRSTQLSAR